MSTSIRADYFYFEPNESTPDQIIAKLKRFVESQGDDFVEQYFNHHQYRLSRVKWTARFDRFSGVMYKKRPTNLPDELTDKGEHTVDIEETSALGDPVCFCYYPRAQMAIIQFNAMGARHSTLREFLQTSVGIDEGIQTSPVISHELRKRLSDIDFARELSFTVRNPERLGDLSEEFGSGLGGDLDALLGHTGGVNVSIKVSMGHDRKGSLKVPEIVKWATRLLKKEEVCTSLKLRGSMGAGEHIHKYDLLNDRIVEHDIEVPDAENGRSINTDRCIERMHHRYMTNMDPE